MRVEAKAILFDNDGVLVDSHAEVHQAWQALAHEFSLDFVVLEQQLVGARAGDTLGRHLEGSELAHAVQRLEDLEVELAARTKPLHGAKALLEALPANSWAVVTSGSLRLATARLVAAILPEVTAMISAESVSSGKPSPEPYLAGAKLLGVNPGDCLVFEDSAPGGTAAVASGAAVIAVGNQSWEVEPLARVPDLSAVKLAAVNSGRLTLEMEAR